ncbi:DNA cytosine methyltransferase [Oenococcus sicerae]|uniref:Cytosine-specific methyltransferase n=1 Tax=Oenococcus sicerae TaxID=2203724 RepID=A0ABX5QPE3_9LACO|nr:DNA cytosine methyltransferase [Oenococcus sicerae]QAS70653.1 DNA cytosine methyltransferase [Oenococcus sicerae]
MSSKKLKINAVDLFCGVGGLTNGVQRSGINVVAGFDILQSCRFPYEYNNSAKFILKDVKKIKPGEIDKLYPKDTDIKVLMGCAPCQPFSTYSHRYKDSPNRITKMDLLDYFGKQVQEVHPDIVSMENVPQIANEDVFDRFVELLKNEGYQVDWRVVYAPTYGVPQSRHRLLLLASKFGTIQLEAPLFDKDHYPTVREAISGLPKLEAGQTDPNDPLHRSRALRPINLNRIKHSKPGGSWQDWPKDLLPEAYKKESGRTFGSVYGRLEWDKPSSTITTEFVGYGNGRFGHPDQNRALSLREGAIIQTFPRDYQFVDPNQGDNYSMSKVALQIGNAVPVKLGQVIGESIQKHLEEI